MLKYEPKGVEPFELNTVILDLNGTLSVNGQVPDGVRERLDKLKALGFKIYLFSGDQRGTAAGIAINLGIELQKATTLEEKAALTNKLDLKHTVAIGNARIDIGTFKPVKLRIGTLQAEGIHVEILKHIDVLTPSINDALDLLLNPDSLCATMRL